jgi:crotonobetainyl-CoA:carnitine CoA-transferase CaiB-like acyl-CoA transferase
MTIPQAFLHAGAEAATASMLAYFARLRDGHGQKVVVNVQACIVWTLMNEQAYPLLHGQYMRRTGPMVGSGDTARKTLYRCSDGWVTFTLSGGIPHDESSQSMIAWMIEEGAAPDWLQDIDWTTWQSARFMARAASDPGFMELVRKSEEAVGRFFTGKTKKELYHGALKRRILLAPVSTPKDIAEDEQLAARQYFRTVRHEGVGRDLALPGRFARFNSVRTGELGPAPRLGEHNLDVYRELLNIKLERIRHLYTTGVI